MFHRCMRAGAHWFVAGLLATSCAAHAQSPATMDLTQTSVPLTLGHPSDVKGMATSADGKLLFSLDGKGLLKMWDLAAGAVRAQRHTGCGFARHISAVPAHGGTELRLGCDYGEWSRVQTDGRQLGPIEPIRGPEAFEKQLNAARVRDRLPVGADIVVAAEGMVRRHDLRTGQLLWQATVPKASLDKAVADPGGKWFAFLREEPRAVLVFDADTGNQRAQVPLAHRLESLAVSGNGDTLLVFQGTPLERVSLHDPATGRETRLFKDVVPAFSRYQLAQPLPDGRLLIATDGRIAVHQPGRPLTHVSSNLHHATAVAFDPGGNRLAFGSADGTTWLLDLRSGLWRPLTHTSLGSKSLAFSSDGAQVVSGFTRAIRVWNVEDGRPRASIQLTEGVTSVRGQGAAAGARREIWAASPDGVKAWQAESNNSQPLADGPLARLEAAQRDGDLQNQFVPVFSPDGKLLVWAHKQRGLQVTDIASGKEVSQLRKEGTPSAAAVSADGRTLAVARYRELRLFSLPQGELLRAWKLERRSPSQVALSHDGATVFAAADDALEVFDSATGNRLAAMDGLPDNVMLTSSSRFAVHPDGTRIAVVAQDGTAQLWDWRAGRRLLRLAAIAPDQALALDETGEVHAYRPGALTDAALGTQRNNPEAILAAVRGTPAGGTSARAATAGGPQVVLRGLPAQSPSGRITFEMLLENNRRPPARYDLRVNGALQPTPLACGAPREQEVRAWRALQLPPGRAEIHVDALDAEGRTLASAMQAVEVLRPAQAAARARLVVQAGMGGPFELAWSPDGQLVLARGTHQLAVLNAADGRELQRVRLAPRWMGLAREAATFIDEGRHFVSSGTAAGSLAVWDALRAQAVFVRQIDRDPMTVSASPARDCVAVLTQFSEEVLLFDAALAPVGKLTPEFPAAAVDVNDEEGIAGFAGAAVWSEDGRQLAVVHRHGWVVLWDVAAGRQLASGRLHKKDVEVLRWDTDGTLVALDAEGGVTRWDAQLANALTRSPEKFANAKGLSRDAGGRWYVGTDAGAAVLGRDLQLQARLGDARGALAPSGDGAAVIGASASGALTRWALPDEAAQWRAYDGEEQVAGLVVSANGRYAIKTLVAVTSTPALPVRYQLWDLEDGRPVVTVEMPTPPERFHLSPALSPDAQWMAAGSDRGEVVVWRAHTGELRRVEQLPGRMVTALAFDATGRQLLVATADPKVHAGVTAAETESIDRLFDRSFESDAHTEKAYRALMTPGAADLRTWDVAASRWAGTQPVEEFVVHLAARPRSRQWAATGLRGDILLGGQGATRRIHREKGDVPTALAFSPDGGKLLASLADVALVFDLAAPPAPPLRVARAGGSEGLSAAWSPDGRRLWLADEVGLRTASLRPARARALRPKERVVHISRDGSTLLVSDDKVLRVADAAGRHTATIAAPGWVQAWLSADGTRVVAGSMGWLKVFDRTGGALGGIEERIGSGDNDLHGRFSADGRRFYFLSSPAGRPVLQALDTSSGASVLQIPLSAANPRSFAVSARGDSVYVGYADGTVAEHKLAEGREVARWKVSDVGIGALDVAPAGDLLLAAAGYTIHAWSLAEGRRLNAYSSGRLVTGFSGELLRFAPDGASAVLIESRRHYRTNDAELESAQTSWGGIRFHPRTGAVYDAIEGAKTAPRTEPMRVVASEDGAMLGWVGEDLSFRTSRGADVAGRSAFTAAGLSHLHPLPSGLLLALDGQGAAGVWRLADGERIAHWAALGRQNWVVADPQGRFDAARLDAIAKAHWVLDREPGEGLPIELFMRDFYEPQLLAKVLAGEKLAPVAHVPELDRTRAVLQIEEVRATDRAGTVDVAVAMRAAPAGAAVRDLKLFLDGRLVGLAFNDQPVQVRDAPMRHVFRAVELPPGAAGAAYELSAYAFNAAGIKTATATHVYRLPQGLGGEAPRAHVLAVGIDHYASRQWNLGFAVTDAQGVHGELRRHLAASAGFKEVRATVLLSQAGALRKTSKPSILNALAALSEGAARARPQDAVYISWAGHGLRDEQGNFYLLTSDFAGLDRGGQWKAKAISMDEIAAALLPVHAAQWTLVIDACHSAATVTSGGFKPGPMGSRGLGQLAYDKRMRVLAASQESGAALESRYLKSGLLTYALVQEGLQQSRADFLPQDKVISVFEWLQYGRARVPVLVQGGREGVRGATVVGLTRAAGVTQKPALFDFARQDGGASLQVLKKLP